MCKCPGLSCSSRCTRCTLILYCPLVPWREPPGHPVLLALQTPGHIKKIIYVVWWKGFIGSVVKIAFKDHLQYKFWISGNLANRKLPVKLHMIIFGRNTRVAERNSFPTSFWQLIKLPWLGCAILPSIFWLFWLHLSFCRRFFFLCRADVMFPWHPMGVRGMLVTVP